MKNDAIIKIFLFLQYENDHQNMNTNQYTPEMTSNSNQNPPNHSHSQLVRIREILKTRRSLNRVLNHENDKNKITQSACNILYDTGHYNCVWIALLDKGKRLKHFANAGFDDTINKLKSNIEKGELPACAQKAINQSDLILIEEPPLECASCPMAKNHGSWSAFATRLEHEGKQFGMLSASVPLAFANNKEEQELFTEIAADIAFSLNEVVNITKSSELEQLLKEQIENNQNLVNSLFETVSVLDNQGNFLFANNNTAKNMTGESMPPDIIGKNLNEFLPSSQSIALIEQYRQIIATNMPIRQEVNISSLGGEKWFANSLSPIIFGANSIKAVLSVSMDISNQKQSELALKKSEEKFKFLAKSTFEGIIIHKKGIVVDVNEAFVKITGYSKEEAIGQNLLDYLSTVADKAKVLLNMVKFKATPYTVTGRCKDGSTFIAELEAKNVKHQGETVRIAALRDVTERHNMQKRIEESERRMKTLLGNLPGMAYRCKKAENCTMQFLNDGCMELTGYKPNELINNKNNSYGEIIHPEDKIRVRETVQKALKRNNSFELEYRIITKQNKVKWVWERGRNVGNGDQSIVEGFISDITLRKVADEKIKHSEQELKKAQSIGKMGNWVINLNTGEIYGSEEIKRIYGFDAGPPLNPESIEQCHLPPHQNALAEAIEKLKTGEIDKYDLTFKLKNRISNQIIDARIISEYDATTNIISGIVQDVTDRVKSEIELRDSEEKYRKISALFRLMNDTMPDMVWAKDLDYKYMFANKAFCEKLLCAKDTSEPLGKTDLFFALRARDAHPENPEWHTFGELCQNTDVTTLRELKKMQFDEYGNVRGKFLFLDVHKAPLFDDGGKLIGIVGSARDVTKSKEAEQKLIAKNKELILAKEKAEESDRLKSAFLTNMSHEIRTPMNGILGFAELLKEPDLTGEEKQKFVKVIQKSGHRMLTTINDLINISKIESGQEELNLREVNLHQLLIDLYDFFLPEAKTKAIDLILENDLYNEPLILHTDQDKLNSILTNLIKNALKFTKKGTITFGYKIEKSNIELKVEDTGIGIPEHRRKAIFERFVQADIEDTRVFEGSGLGLAITKSYVEMLNGEIWLNSQEEKGSTFFVSLPFEPGNEKAETIFENPATEQPQPGNKKLKILIAEDDAPSLYHLSIILKNIAGEILSVNNGQEAVALCRDNPDIDLILMDIKMPVMDGLKATALIREFNQELVIIAQTAYALPGDSEKALEAGCNDYIAKPIDREILLNMIHRFEEKNF